MANAAPEAGGDVSAGKVGDMSDCEGNVHSSERLAVFLDRDGTLIENRHYLADPQGVVVLPGVVEAIRRLLARGAKLFLFTNQSGVGRGYFSLDDVRAVNARMIEEIGLGVDLFAGVCIAPEAPCEVPLYRKPSPRFLLETLHAQAIPAATCWMVGDSPSDWEAGLNAGVHAVAVGGGIPAQSAFAKNSGDRHAWELRGVRFHAGLLDWVVSQGW